MDLLKQIFDKVRHDFNNSVESWNKGLTVNYTIFTTEKGQYYISMGDHKHSFSR